MSLTVDPDLDTVAWEEGEYMFRRVWDEHWSESRCVGWIIQDGHLWRWGLYKDWMAAQGSGFHDFTEILHGPLPEPEAIAAMYAVWRMKYGGKE